MMSTPTLSSNCQLVHGICTTKHQRNTAPTTALWFKSLGAHVVEIVPYTKRPYRVGWEIESLSDSEIRTAADRGSNFAVVLGENWKMLNTVVVGGDFDTKYGYNQTEVEALAKTTLSQRSPSGGVHLFFRIKPKDLMLFRSWMVSLGANTVRGTGTYILIAGSWIDLSPEHPSRYTLADQLSGKPKKRERGGYTFINQTLPILWTPQ